MLKIEIQSKSFMMKKELIAILKKTKEFLSVKLKAYDEKLPYIVTSLIFAIIVIGGIRLFIELIESLKSDYLANYDNTISNFFTNLRSPWLTSFFKFITNLGDSIGYAIVFGLSTLFFYLKFKNWKYVAQIVLVMVLALGSNLLLKKTINRARPVAEHLVTVKTLSFPSGHATMAMAFYGFLIYLVFTFSMNIYLKITFISILTFIILSIGISRIYLGVHFPSDVAGGFIAGFIWVIFCVMIFNLIKIFKRDSAT